MDQDLIALKLEAIRHCLRRIESRCPRTATELGLDADAQDIVSLNLTRAVQLCVDIAAHVIAESESAAPQTMGQAFDRLPELGHIPGDLAVRMKKAVGFRNLAVHSYDAINWEIVHAIATRQLHDFSDFAHAVLPPPESR